MDGIKKNTEAHGNDTQYHINRNIIQAILYNYIIIMYLPKYRISGGSRGGGPLILDQSEAESCTN